MLIKADKLYTYGYIMSDNQSAEQQQQQQSAEQQSNGKPTYNKPNRYAQTNFNKQNKYNSGSTYAKGPNMAWNPQNGYPAPNQYQPFYPNQTPIAPVSGQSPSPQPTENSAETSETENSEDADAKAKAELVRKSFVEQVKARKAALEKKRLEEKAAAEKAAAEKAAAEKAVAEKAAAEKAAAEKAAAQAEADASESAKEEQIPASLEQENNEGKETKSEGDDSTPKVMTFSERLRLKKLQKAQETGEDSTTTTPPAEEEKPAPVESKDDEIKTEAEKSVETPVEEDKKDTHAENETEAEKEPETPIDPNAVTMTQILERLSVAKPIEDIYAFKYPENIEAPDERYKKEHIKYTYGPAFLLQFKEPTKAVADPAWVESTGSKIVIPPGMGRGNRSRDPSKFGGRNGDFRSNSMREGGSRNSSKRKSRRDNRSQRSYTSRRDRERGEEKKADEKPKEEVAPLVPTANRWVPKSRKQKTEKKFAPDGVTELFGKEEIESKMKALLNKLTLEKFDSISAEILALANLSKFEKEGETLKTVIEQVFLKACDEPHWSSMYAQLCGKVVKDLDSEIIDETNEGKVGPKLVLHYLVARCHEEFQKGWTDKLPTNEDGSPLEPEMMSDEYYQAAAAKRRGLGLVRFIGYLYRLNLLTAKMMFECFRRLMKDLNDNPSEDILESLVELLETVGQQFESDKLNAGSVVLEGSALLDTLFTLIQTVIDAGEISNRIKFKLLDIKELREVKRWSNDKRDNGPKTIQQIHEEDERQRALKNNSRSNSRRNNNSMGGSNRSSRREREQPPVTRDKDNFVTTRSYSQRSVQKAPVKEEAPAPQSTAATNMFSALMDNSDDDE